MLRKSRPKLKIQLQASERNRAICSLAVVNQLNCHRQSLGGSGGGGEPDLEGRPGGAAEEEEAANTAEAARLWDEGLGGRGGGTGL